MAKSKKRVKKVKGQSKTSSHLKGSLTVIKPVKVISTSADDISVVADGPDNMKHENIYDDSIPSDVIALSTAADLGFPLERSYQEKFIEAVEQVKGTYLEEVEVSVWPPKIKIKRTPKKIIKFFKAKEAKRKSNK